MNASTHRRSYARAAQMGVKNIWRNKTLSLATIFVIAAIIFIFNIILAIQLITENALSELSKKIDVVVYLKESTTPAIATQIAGELQQLEGVLEVRYTSKENALQELQTLYPNLSTAFEKYQLGNPLPASLDVVTTHPRYHSEIAKTLQQPRYLPYLSNVITAGEDETQSVLSSVSKNLIRVTDFAEHIIIWLILTFIAGGTLVIINALHITIYSRKQEISIMQLVGAPHWFIRFPFILESMIYGLAAIIVSALMLTILGQSTEIAALTQYLSLTQLFTVYVLEIIITLLLSIASAYIAVHQYLRRTVQ